MDVITLTIDARGTVVIPAKVRRRLGIEAGSLLILEEREGEVVLRPAVVVAARRLTPEQRAEMALSAAKDAAEYERAVEEVCGMGIDPARVAHDPPTGVARVR